MKEALFKSQLCGIYNQNLKKTNLAACSNKQAHGFFNHNFDTEGKRYQMAVYTETKRQIKSSQLIANNQELKVVSLDQQPLWQGFNNYKQSS